MKTLKDGKHTVLLITHVIPTLRAAGNEVRILKLLRWLSEQQYSTTLLFNQHSVADSVRNGLREYVDTIYTTGDLIAAVDPRVVDPVLEPYKSAHPDKQGLCPRELVSQTFNICQRHHPDIVIAEYVFTAPCLDVVPRESLKCIDTHDMFSRRDRRESLCCTPEEERAFLLKADLIWAIVENEASMFRALVPEREVIVVGHDFEIVPEATDQDCIPGTVLVVGSENQPNRQGLKAFCSNAWPQIHERRPDARLRIVGRVSAGITFDDPSINPVGWVERVSGEYGKAEVVVNPTEIGTGFKTKTAEALCHGKATVGTLNSVEGLPEEDPSPFVACGDWQSFAESVVSLLASPRTRAKYQESALKYAKKHFGAEASYGALKYKLDRFTGRKP